MHLDDEALRVLQDAGVADEFAAVSRPMAGLRLLDGRLAHAGRVPPATPRPAHGWPQASMFHQPDLEAVLLAAAAAEPRVALQRGASRSRALAPERRRRRGSRPRPRRGADAVLLADAVLGCDGAHSTVRAADRGPACATSGRAERWLVVDVRSPRPLPVWPGVHQVCDPARAATFMPVTGDRYRWEFRLGAGETAADLTTPASLAALLAPWTGGARRCEVVRAAEYTFRARVADRWRAGRVLLAGDAAHLTPPFIGQGLGARAARRPPAGLEARRRAARGGRRRAAGHLPGRAGAARPGADPARPAARAG